MIVETDAIGNPWTVMIHFKNASVTLTAVMRSVWLRDQAPLTQAHTSMLLLFNRHNFLLVIILLLLFLF